MNEQPSLETRLRASQVYNRSIIEACPAPLLVVDPKFDITDVNEESVKLMGSTRKELIGSPLESHFSVPPQDANMLRWTLDTGTSSKLIMTLRSRPSNESPVPVRVSTFNDPDGERRGILVVLSQ